MLNKHDLYHSFKCKIAITINSYCSFMTLLYKLDKFNSANILNFEISRTIKSEPIIDYNLKTLNSYPIFLLN